MEEMEYKEKYYNGEVPESGAIFMSNIGTKKECLRRKLFGLPSGMSDFVLHVKKGMTLFLFEFERRLMHGVFRATSDGEINIEPGAFRSSGKHFPAQVRFTSVWDCSPLAEHEFQDAIRDNYFSGKKFNFGLNKDQVAKLLKLFRSKKSSKSHTEREVLRCVEPAEGDSRFGDLRKDMRDRLKFASEEHGDFGSEEVEEVGDHFYSTKNSVEVRQKDNRDGFVTNYKTHYGGFGDCVTRQDVLGKHRDHSLGGLKRVADAGLNFMVDANDGHEMHGRFEEKKGLTNEDSFFMMENRRREHDINDGYIPLFTEPHEKRYGEISIARNDANFLMDGKNKDDYARMDDEYNVREVFRKSLSECHLGSPCGIESQTINDRYEFSNEAVDNELRRYNEHSLSKPAYDEDIIFRPRTLTEHSVCTPIETTFGIKPVSDKFGLESFSHLGRNTYSLSCDPTRKEVPESRLSPFYFADGSSFIPLDDGPLYPSSNEIPTLLPMSPLPPCYSHNEGSMRYFEDPDYASLTKSQLTVEGKSLYDTAFLEGLKISLYPDFISERLSSSDAGLCVREEDSIDNVMRFCRPHSSDVGLHVREEDPVNNHKRSYQSRESKHSFGTDKRVSVFSRLNSALRHEEREFETDKKHELDASVDKVMKMSEKAVSFPIKKSEKRKAAFKQDGGDKVSDYNTVDYELPEVRMELDADLADEETEDGLPLPETRIVDFKRRKKANKRVDNTSKEKSKCLVDATSDVGPVENNNSMGASCKRRKLVRPAFVETKSTTNGVCATLDTNMCQNSPSTDYNISTKKVLESSEKVDASIKFVDTNMMPNSQKLTLPKGDKKSTETALESSEEIVESIKAVEDVFRMPTSLEKIPSKEDSSLTEAVLGGSEKVGVSVESVEVLAECQKTSNEQGKCEQVAGDGNAESTSSKDGYSSTKAVLEISEKADVFVKSVKLPVECQKSGQEAEESSQVEDGNAEKCIA